MRGRLTIDAGDQPLLIWVGKDNGAKVSSKKTLDGNILDMTYRPINGTQYFLNYAFHPDAAPDVTQALSLSMKCSADFPEIHPYVFPEDVFFRTAPLVDISTLTPTPTITPTVTPTPTETATSTPTPPSAGLTFTSKVSTNQLFTGSCGVNTVTIQSLVSDPSQVRDMILFTNIKNQNNGKTTGWDGGSGMSSTGNGVYQVTLAAGSIPNYNAYDSSWLLYQFVATGDGGAVIGRSQTFNDIAITRCEAAPPPENPTIVVPPIYNRLTPTLVFPPILR
jgi:hypothetical protein